MPNFKEQFEKLRENAEKMWIKNHSEAIEVHVRGEREQLHGYANNMGKRTIIKNYKRDMQSGKDSTQDDFSQAVPSKYEKKFSKLIKDANAKSLAEKAEVLFRQYEYSKNDFKPTFFQRITNKFVPLRNKLLPHRPLVEALVVNISNRKNFYAMQQKHFPNDDFESSMNKDLVKFLLQASLDNPKPKGKLGSMISYLLSQADPKTLASVRESKEPCKPLTKPIPLATPVESPAERKRSRTI